MIYARAHDRTVAEDYYGAMKRIEQELDLAGLPTTNGNGRVSEAERSQLLAVADRLADPLLGYEGRLVLVEQTHLVLDYADKSPHHQFA